MMRSIMRQSRHECPCFPFPVSREAEEGPEEGDTVSSSSAPYLATRPSTMNAPKLQGKLHKSAVNGHLSIASILSNAFQLPSFPRTSVAMSQAGKLGMTFAQIDVASKRVALMISSLVVLPGTEQQVSSNSDGDSVILLILDEESQADSHLIVLLIAVLRLGATCMVVSQADVATPGTAWTELLALIEPILVITTSDPNELPTQMRNDLNLISRDQFEDFHEDESTVAGGGGASDTEEESTTELNPFQASTLLVKKIRSSLIMKPSTYLKPSTVAFKILWDLAMELSIPHERDVQLLHFRSDIPHMGQRTAFIFKCVSSSPHASPVELWCRLGHKALRNRISWERLEFPVKATERLVLTFPLTDPRSLVQIFNCFIHGKMLILGEPGEFHNAPFLFRKLGSDAFSAVQRLELTPERLQDLLQCATHQPRLEHLVSRIKVWIVTSSADDPFTYSLAKHFFQVVKTNDVMLIVTYGTPECLFCATWNMFFNLKEVSRNVILEKDGEGKLFAGLPTTNSSVLLVDERRSTLLPVGQRGEICLLGSMIPVAGYCGTPLLARNWGILPTGDTGRFLQDKSGQFQLVVDASSPEGSLDSGRRKVMIQRKLVDLEELSRQVKHNSTVVREAFAFICQRGCDFPEIVVAVALKDTQKFEQVQELIADKLPGFAANLPLTSFPVQGPIIPRLTTASLQESDKPGASSSLGDPVDLKALRAQYFKFLGRVHPRDWLSLIPARTPGRPRNAAEEAIEKTIQITCQAVAFSLGVPLKHIIDNFEKSFWELGGTPLRAISTVKSCVCQGKTLCIEDFMTADRISELGFRLVFAEKGEGKWAQEIELVRQFFIYSRVTRSDHPEILDLLLSTFVTLLGPTDPKKLESYANSLIDIFDNSLSAVALSGENREMLGIALNYRGSLRSHPRPGRLEESVELCHNLVASCRHLTQGVDPKNIAKCYMICLKVDALVHPSQLLLVLRDLLRESMNNAQSVGCQGFMICTQDPLVQEVCCSLLGFEPLAEIQLNLYRNKRFQKPFAHLDDHQLMGLYFAKMG